METIILCVISAAVAWKASQFWHVIAFKKILEDLGISSQQLEKLNRQLSEVPGFDTEPQEPQAVVEVRLEQLDGVILAYRKSDDQFLAQATDRDSLIQRLTENLTPCRVVIAKEDGADLIS
jgi:vacuolar-type H+-ATPase subunit I/STV1